MNAGGAPFWPATVVCRGLICSFSPTIAAAGGANPAAAAAAAALVVAAATVWWFWWWRRRQTTVYLIDYSCVKCRDEYKTNLETMFYFFESLGRMKGEDMHFQCKMFLRSGIGEEAYVPRVNLEEGADLRLRHSRELASELIVGAVERLLKKTAVPASAVDFLVVNSGTFSPTPSLCSAVIRHLGMRHDIRSFELDGMGCSASLIAVDLARRLLQNAAAAASSSSYFHRRPRQRFAVVASAEVIRNLYEGSDKSMMLTNCLFRAAGNALLLSVGPAAAEEAKMELLHVERAVTAAKDESYGCVVMMEDEEGHVGARLSPDLLNVAAAAVAMNLTRLAPRVLPLGELVRAALDMVGRKVWKTKKAAYVPNFKRAFEHFCIHPGGKAVVKGVGAKLGLSEDDVEPSAMALHRFGNTSCSGIWYILAYMEAKKRLQKGDRVLQIGLGSGFKCTTAVWKVRRSFDDDPIAVDSPWDDTIHRYPVTQRLDAFTHVQEFVHYVNSAQRFQGLSF